MLLNCVIEVGWRRVSLGEWWMLVFVFVFSLDGWVILIIMGILRKLVVYLKLFRFKGMILELNLNLNLYVFNLKICFFLFIFKFVWNF